MQNMVWVVAADPNTPVPKGPASGKKKIGQRPVKVELNHYIGKRIKAGELVEISEAKAIKLRNQMRDDQVAAAAPVEAPAKPKKSGGE